MRHRLASLVVIALLGGIVLALAVRLMPGPDAADSGFARDVIRIGYAIEAPYAFLAPDGAVTGESPAVAREVVRRLGIGRTDWVQSSFPDLIEDLLEGRFDVVAAGLFIDRERARRVLFSRPTFRVRQGLLVQAGNPKQLHSYADAVRMDGARVAVISGSAEERVLLASGMPDLRLFQVPDARTGWVAVASRRVDALALSTPSIRWMAQASDLSRVEVATPFDQPPEAVAGRMGYGAFAFRRRDTRLREAWDSVLRSFVGTEEHRRLVAPFGFSAAEFPGAVSAADVVRP